MSSELVILILTVNCLSAYTAEINFSLAFKFCYFVEFKTPLSFVSLLPVSEQCLISARIGPHYHVYKCHSADNLHVLKPVNASIHENILKLKICFYLNL